MATPSIPVALASDFYDYYDHMLMRATDPRAAAGVLWRRTTKDTVPREERLGFMNRAGLPVAPYGKVGFLFGLANRPNHPTHNPPGVVVYHDPLQHAGEGKELVRWEDIARRLEDGSLPYDTLASIFLGQLGTPAIAASGKKKELEARPIAPTTIRGLWLPDGRRRWYRYRGPSSTSEWRSNVGDVVITAEREDEVWATHEPLPPWERLRAAFADSPIVAVDFVLVNGRLPSHTPSSLRRHGAGKPVTQLFAIDYNTAPRLRDMPGLPEELPPSEMAHSIQVWAASTRWRGDAR